MRILFLSAWLPYPPDNGAKLRIYHLLRGLAQHHEVTLLSYDGGIGGEPPARLRELCQAVHLLPERTYNASSARALLGFFSRTPRVLVDRYVPEMAARIREEVRRGGYDLVIASEWYMAYYEPAFRGVPAIFEEAEVGVFRDKIAQARSPLHRLRHELTTLKMQAYFRGLLSRFKACTVASETERALLMKMVAGYTGVEVIPNGASLADYRPALTEPMPDTLIFTGSFRYRPNYDAMTWFLGQVYPLVKAAVPGVKLTITGDQAGLPLPDAEGVTLTGYVDDVRPYLASAWASLAPLHSGGGTRLKILEALALHTPVVATSKGAEGLDLQNGRHILLADTPEDFAGQVIRLLKDPRLRRQIADNAYQLACEKYDWDVILPKFLALVEQASGHSGKLAPIHPVAYESTKPYSNG
ncbi:MAG TPA: glycosyltransferase [Anaerolineales bacterium]